MTTASISYAHPYRRSDHNAVWYFMNLACYLIELLIYQPFPGLGY